MRASEARTAEATNFLTQGGSWPAPHISARSVERIRYTLSARCQKATGRRGHAPLVGGKSELNGTVFESSDFLRIRWAFTVPKARAKFRYSPTDFTLSKDYAVKVTDWRAVPNGSDWRPAPTYDLKRYGVWAKSNIRAPASSIPHRHRAFFDRGCRLPIQVSGFTIREGEGFRQDPPEASDLETQRRTP